MSVAAPIDHAPGRAAIDWADYWRRRGHGCDLFQLLRRIDAAHPQLPRLGSAGTPRDEAVRVSQPADLSFAPSAVVALERETDGGRLWLRQRVFGLVGPNGPLPLHLTELAGERSRIHGDRTLQAFFDMLTQRYAMFFYRAWAQAQPVVDWDRPAQSAFHRWLGALSGIGLPALQHRDALGDEAKLHFSGRLARHKRDADGLLAWCRGTFDVPFRIQQWFGQWLAIEGGDRARLSRRAQSGLGRGLVLGNALWDVQHKFLLVIGPLDYAPYRRFLPDGADLARLRALVRQWVGIEFAWDLRLVLRAAEVPRLRLGGAAGSGGALGRSAWLGRRAGAGDAEDFQIDVEQVMRRGRRAPGVPVHPAAAADAADLPSEPAASLEP